MHACLRIFPLRRRQLLLPARPGAARRLASHALASLRRPLAPPAPRPGARIGAVNGAIVSAMEFLRIAPRGMGDVHKMLFDTGGAALLLGGAEAPVPAWRAWPVGRLPGMAAALHVPGEPA